MLLFSPLRNPGTYASARWWLDFAAFFLCSSAGGAGLDQQSMNVKSFLAEGCSVRVWHVFY